MKKKNGILIGIIIFLSMICIPVMAKTNNGFYSDEDIKLEKKVNTSTFVFGNNIEIKSEIEGLNFVAGNNISLSSHQDYLFTAGNSINLENVTAKDAFIAGNLINIQSSTIRDLYAAGQTIRIDSDISRNAYLAGDKITINSKIDGDVYVSGEKIRIGKNAVITGTLKYPKGVDVSISESAEIHKQKTFKNSEIKVELSPMDYIVDCLFSYCAMLIIAILLIKVNKKYYHKIKEEKKEASTVFQTILKGFAFLFLVPIACLLIMITVFAIPLSIILLIIYGILVYLSIIQTAYYIGTWLLKDKIKNDYLNITISLLVLYILKSIPLVGAYISLIIILFGLGLYTKYIMDFYQKNNK